MSQASETPRSKMSTPGAGTPGYYYATGGSPRSLSGAEIYAAFMDSYHRRMKKPQPYYGADAAGVTTNQREGKAGRLQSKGRGNPPPDNYYPDYKPAKKFFPGRSHAASDPLAHDATSLSMSMDAILATVLRDAASGAAGARPMSAYQPRLCLKVVAENCPPDHIRGAGMEMINEGPPKRALRRPGTAQPRLDTKSRVMHMDSPAPQDSDSGCSTPSSPAVLNAMYAAYSPKGPSSPADTWARHLYEAGMSSHMPAVAERPSTAPGHGSSKLRHPEAYYRYQAQAAANSDVFRYRHSGGICPADYKLDATRMAAPQLISVKPEAARESYYEARAGFAYNRVRAILSGRTRYN